VLHGIINTRDGMRDRNLLPVQALFVGYWAAGIF
jgi:hypothetical protein